MFLLKIISTKKINSKAILYYAYFLFLLFLSCKNVTDKSEKIVKSNFRSNPHKDGYVPNKEAAIKIAEAIWLPIYGDEIYEYKPFKAILINDSIWKVSGTVHTEMGGSPFAEIQKSNCKVIRVYHEE